MLTASPQDPESAAHVSLLRDSFVHKAQWKKRTRVTQQELMQCARNQMSSEEVLFGVKNQPVLWAL